MEKLELIPLVDLLDKKFFIPSYQRGYRWTERQVEDLLNDILEFQQKKDKAEGEFYCLQPIVVTNMGENKWEVIDGQQRLTTLYLILLHLDNLLEEEYGIGEIYSIEYQTRKDSQEFLAKKVREIDTTDDRNIDYYFMSNAYLTIENWFQKKIETRKITKSNFTKRRFLEVLIDKEIEENNGKKDIANNVRFIWYEIDGKNNNDNSRNEKIFRRINMGKIPLTNAELIKALFFTRENLQENGVDKRQFRIAYEWERIENTLQDKNFWYFLNKEQTDKPSRIEFIFDLIAQKHAGATDIKVDKKHDKYYTFYIFHELIRTGKKAKETLWEEVKTYFRVFEEWHQDDTYYHLIGYLIHNGEKIEDLKRKAEEKSKDKFKTCLKSKIRSGFEFKNISELSYGENNKALQQILFLFNVITTMKSGFVKFPFERYLDEQWSLEHIHAQKSENLKKEEHRKRILEDQKTFFEGKNEGLFKKVQALLEKPKISPIEFRELQIEVFKEFSNIEKPDSITNLTLLSQSDNATLSNNIFPVKRDKIKELDIKGSFIPICTKNVFLKYYSKDVEQMTRWDEKDGQFYLTDIKKTLAEYLPEQEDTDGY